MRFLSNCSHGLSPPSADSIAVIPRMSGAENTEDISSAMLSDLSLIINWYYKVGIVFTSRYNSRVKFKTTKGPWHRQHLITHKDGQNGTAKTQSGIAEAHR